MTRASHEVRSLTPCIWKNQSGEEKKPHPHREAESRRERSENERKKKRREENKPEAICFSLLRSVSVLSKKLKERVPTPLPPKKNNGTPNLEVLEFLASAISYFRSAQIAMVRVILFCSIGLRCKFTRGENNPAENGRTISPTPNDHNTPTTELNATAKVKGPITRHHAPKVTE